MRASGPSTPRSRRPRPWPRPPAPSPRSGATLRPRRGAEAAAAPDNRVAAWRYDGHVVLGSPRAVALAGSPQATPDPPGGVIVRDAAGQPTGALKDAAAELLERVIPAPSLEQRR